MKITISQENSSPISITIPDNKQPTLDEWLDSLPNMIDNFQFKTQLTKSKLTGMLSTTWRKKENCKTMFDVLKMLCPKEKIADWTKKVTFVGTVDTGDTIYIMNDKVYCTFHEDSISYKNVPDIEGAYKPIDIEKCLCWNNIKAFITYINSLIK